MHNGHPDPDVAGLVNGAVQALVAEMVATGIDFPSGTSKLIDELNTVLLGAIRLYLFGYQAGLEFLGGAR